MANFGVHTQSVSGSYSQSLIEDNKHLRSGNSSFCFLLLRMWVAIKRHMAYNRCQWFAGHAGLSIILCEQLALFAHVQVKEGHVFPMFSLQ